MADDIFDIMSGMRPHSDYSLEQIEAAEKRMKKKGGTLQENLQAVTDNKKETARPFSMDGLMEVAKKNAEEISRMMKNSAETEKASKSAQDQLLKNSAELDKQLAELNKNLAEDFGVGQSAGGTQKKTSGEEFDVLDGEKALEAFSGVEDELKKKVFGQDTFLHRLVIAFKRPLVSPPEGKAKNSVLLCGPEDSGKHHALRLLCGELNQRHILKHGGIRKIDLALYPEAAQEKVFLQDMYSALAGSEEVLLFEHYEECHPSFLIHVGSLVTEGVLRLSGRYVLQKGQLVSVQDSLASEAVGELKAEGKYLIFVTNKGKDKLAGVMGAAFVDALGDTCESTELDEEAIKSIAEVELTELTEKAKEQCGFSVKAGEGFAEYAVSRSGRQAGVKGVQDFYDSVLRALVQMKLEGECPKDAELTLYARDGELQAEREGEKIDLTAFLPARFSGEIDAIRKELDEIVGLTEVKKYVLGLEEYYKVQKRREEEGLKTGSVNKHMIFTGSPGTGKTTIARVISKYLKAIGVLNGGQLVEVSRADLVGRYVGHTAPLTNSVINSAIGGVLFIDEAYSLYRGKDDSFGLEAIDTLVKGIEDHREDLIVILAGYSHEMSEFLTSNSGLKSRFPNVIDFPDYTGEELLAISRCIAKSKGYAIDSGADEALTAFFDEVQATRAADAGNGRLARNMVEAAIVNQSKRLVAEPDASLELLMLSDFELEEEDKEEV